MSKFTIALALFTVAAVARAEAPKPAEQQFKNIQVFKGVPAAQIDPTMDVMAGALGVGCDHCHVKADKGPWAMEKDDKAAKRTARKLPGWLARAQRLLLQPTQEWATIAGEFASTGPIYLRYVVPMAAIGPVAATIGGIVFGERGSLLTFGTVPINAGTAVQAGVLEYVLNLVGVYVLAMAIEVIGGSIGGQRNRVQALKVAAYASTPYWLAGAFALFPRIEPLGMLIGLYSVRLFAQGLPAVMKAPRDKTAAFTLLTSIAAALIVLVITAIITRLVVA